MSSLHECCEYSKSIHTYERSDAIAKFTHTFSLDAKLMGIKIPMFLH